MASSLPMYVVLKSKYNSKYLEFVEEEGAIHGYVRFSGENVHSPRSKFHVEPAESDSQLVHLRCCYNNKYLAASNPHWIAAEAGKPVEDLTWSCTSFHPIPSGGDDYRFKHVRTGNYVVLMRMGDSDPKNNCLYPYSPSEDSALCDVCTVIDWKSLVVLPRHVAFKGDNEKYLRALPTPSSATFGPHDLKFAASDIGDPAVAHEVFPNPDGSIRLKSTNNGRFWIHGYGRSWIIAEVHDNRSEQDYFESLIWPNMDDKNKNTHFWPVKLDDNTIALRSLGNDQFCKRYTTWEMQDCLSATISTISKEARLQVMELVLSKDIYNVNYHLSRARRYNEHAVVMGTGAASNTTDKENSMDVGVVHTETETSSWGGSVSLKVGVKTTLEAKVPFILDEKIEISAELTTAFQWGKVHTKTNTVQTVYKASVPPMTKVTVTAVGTTAMCDVPFSYTQTDTLMDGTKLTHEIDGGIYTGVNTFNITYQIKHEKIEFQ